MQPTQEFKSDSVCTAPPQALPFGTVTAGQRPSKPSVSGLMSSLPPHRLSAPPEAWQILAARFASAVRIAAAVLPETSPAGHGVVKPVLPAFSAVQHRLRLFEATEKNFVVSLPIVRSQVRSALSVDEPWALP